MDRLAQLNEAKEKLKEFDFPNTCIVLGSGLGRLPEQMDIETEIQLSDIPHMKQPTVQGHQGKLILGKLGGIRVACLRGRLHYYEGHDMWDVVFPHRVFALSGAQNFILTNAAGGVHADMTPGDLVLIKDHINCMGFNPLIGTNIESLGPRFPDSTYLYDPQLRQMVLKIANDNNIPLREGIYLGTHGPSYETPAEINAYKKMGADLVGMSTVPEAIALGHMGKKIIGISCVTNLAAGVAPARLEHEEVLENAKKAYDVFSTLVSQTVRELQ